MAEHRRLDEYGNPIVRVDEYGNPIRDHPSAYTTGGTGGHGTGTGDYGTTATHETTYPHGVVGGTGAQHQPQGMKEGGLGTGGVLQRSGSSSSSSEDDGMGGRRKKKSIKDKIKEKLPGTHKSETQSTTPITTTGEHGYGTTGAHGHGTTGYGTTGTHGGTTGTTGVHGGTTGTTGVHGGTTGYEGATATGEHEKKGIMEKIKEKLPGHH